MTDYTVLDAAIIKQIKAGTDPYAHPAATEATMLSREAGGKKDPFRYIDSRLQVLRKQGHISYSRQTGWIIPEAP